MYLLIFFSAAYVFIVHSRILACQFKFGINSLTRISMIFPEYGVPK